MKVKATHTGYYGLLLRHEGDVFEMSETAMKKDKATKKPILPSWVVTADAVAPSRVAKEEKEELSESGEETSRDVI